MNRLAVIFLSLWLLAAPAIAQVFPTYWYWQVADSSPATTVFEASSGSFVSNISGPFTTWLSAAAISSSFSVSGLASLVCGDVNNGSGLHRLTLCAAQLGWVTGQSKTVSGVVGATGANGVWTITVIDQITIDLQGTTFGGVYASGGVIGAGTAMDTASHLYSYMNTYNVSLVNAGAGAGYQATTFGTNLQLTNPLTRIMNLTASAGSLHVRLPPGGVFGSTPIGVPITIINNSMNSFELDDSAGGIVVGAITPGETWQVIPRDNSSNAGLFVSAVSFTAPFLGVTCAPGAPSGTFATQNGIVIHC